MTGGFGRTLLFCAAIAAQAATLPDPQTTTQCVDRNVFTDPFACTATGFGASSFTSITLSPFVSLVAEDSSGPVDFSLGLNPSASASSTLRYFFEVEGGTPGDLVPLLIRAGLTANASSASDAEAFSEILVDTSRSSGGAVVCSNDSCGTTASSFFGTFGVLAVSGEVGTVVLEVNVGSGDSLFAQSANASADPLIFVDPSFANANAYTIAVSPGVANAIADAPEPGTIVLFLLGMALVGQTIVFSRLPRCKAKRRIFPSCYRAVP